MTFDAQQNRQPRARDEQSPFCIVMAEDDPDDRLLTRRALQKHGLANDLITVEDGEQLMDFLHRRGPHADRSGGRPGLILLDLNMPRMDGREVLREIKSDEKLRRIPVVMLTTSKAERDVVEAYDLGVNAFVTKPVTFDGLAEAVQSICNFWFEIVELPKV